MLIIISRGTSKRSIKYITNKKFGSNMQKGKPNMQQNKKKFYKKEEICLLTWAGLIKIS